MSYKQLYTYCQTLPVHINRNLVRDRALELVGVERIAVRLVDIDERICRGKYLSGNNTDHPIVKQHGGHVIVLARSLNRCWQRFVFTKELMHLFDGHLEATDSGDAFELLLADLSEGTPSGSPQLKSEYMAFWMALGALCPEAERLDLEAKLADGTIDEAAIAQRLRIPLFYVPRLFEPRYKKIIGGLVF